MTTPQTDTTRAEASQRPDQALADQAHAEALAEARAATDALEASGDAPRHRFGMRIVTWTGLLALAVAGLALRDTQVPVWSFGDAGPDARSLPTVALGLLAAVLVVQLLRGLRRTDRPLGRMRDWLPLVALVLVTAAGLWLMPRFGFMPCAAVIGMATALAFGERRVVYMVGLPVLVAVLVGFGATSALNIPLP